MRYRRSGKSNWFTDLNSGEKIRISVSEAKRRNRISDALISRHTPGPYSSIPSLAQSPDFARMWRRIGNSNWYERENPQGKVLKMRLSWKNAARRNAQLEGIFRYRSETGAEKAGAQVLTTDIFKMERPIGDTFVKIYARQEDGTYKIINRQIVSPDQFFKVFKPFMRPSGLMLTGYYAYEIEPIIID